MKRNVSDILRHRSNCPRKQVTQGPCRVKKDCYREHGDITRSNPNCSVFQKYHYKLFMLIALYFIPCHCQQLHTFEGVSEKPRFFRSLLRWMKSCFSLVVAMRRGCLLVDAESMHAVRRKRVWCAAVCSTPLKKAATNHASTDFINVSS